MYDPLDFNQDELHLIDELTYRTAVYNHHKGVDWEGIKRIFPDNGPIMEARYLAECKNSDIDV